MAIRVTPGTVLPTRHQLELEMEDDAGVDQWTETNVNTGASDYTGMALALSSGATANSTAIRQTGGETAVTRGSRFDKVDWSQPITIYCRFCIQANTTNGVSMFSLGKANADGYANLAKRGISIFRVANLALSGHVHNGTDLTATDLLTTLTATQVYDMRVESDGAGNVTWYLDGVAKGTTTAGPTTESASVDDSNWQLEVGNGADSAAQGLVLFGCWWESE